MKKYQIFQNNVKDFCNINTIKKYKLWVYTNSSNMISVYKQSTLNTEQIWFKFYSFSYFYWRMVQDKCFQSIKGDLFYNFYQLKMFILNYLLCETNVPGVIIERNEQGELTQKSMESVLSIHPRILRTLFEMIEIFPQELTKKENENLEKQCMKLFGKGESVYNPHPWVVNYCNLIAFWEKFGLNYYDIMNLPYELFISLKKILSLDNNYKSQSLSKKSANSTGVNF